MTKEITKAFILQEIQDKFKLRELEPERFRFLEAVRPVYNIEQHLKHREILTTTVSITATGGKIICSIPSNERWTLSRYTVVFLVAGAYKVAGVYLVRRNDSSVFCYLDLKKNQTESYAVDLPKDVILEDGDYLMVNIDDYISTANLRIYFDVVKEEIR